MGKKGTKRKTRWRVLPIGEDGGGSCSGNEEEAECDATATTTNGSSGSYARATQPRSTFRRPNYRGNPSGGGGGYYNKQQYHHNSRSYNNHEGGGADHRPLVTTEKQIFNEEEYTKITTPRQDVLFKKGYLGRKRPPVTTTTESSDQATSAADVVNGNVGHYDPAAGHNDGLDNDPNEMVEEQPQFIYTNGFVDQSGIYYINGSGYEIFDPYSGQVTVLVGPHYGPNGGPPVLAAVPCQPVPLQPLEWFNPPGFLPYVTAPCHNGLARDRRKRYSTDSQNCSPQSSESTGPPGSPQESDEVAVNGGAEGAMYHPHHPPPPPYVYPGYMFGAPMYNMNGVTVQSTPNAAPSSDVGGKRRKKKRRRRRRRNGVEDGSEESSSEDKDHEEEPMSVTSQESSLESDSKLSTSGEILVPPTPPTRAVPADAFTQTSTTAAVVVSASLNEAAVEFHQQPTPGVEEVKPQQQVVVATSEVKTQTPLVNGHNEVDVKHATKESVDRPKLNDGPNVGRKDYSNKEVVVVVNHVNGDRLVNGNESAKTKSEKRSEKKGKKAAAAASDLSNGQAEKHAAALVAKRSDDSDDFVFEDDSILYTQEFINGNVKVDLDEESEWITVRGHKGSQGKRSDSGRFGGEEKKFPAELTNGHAKTNRDYKVNGVNGKDRLPFSNNNKSNNNSDKLSKADNKSCFNGNKVEEKCTYSKVKPSEAGNKEKTQVNGKAKLVNGSRMDGNEKDDHVMVGKEVVSEGVEEGVLARKASGENQRDVAKKSSAQEVDEIAPPTKPSRKERKTQKNGSPPKTPEVTTLTATARPFEMPAVSLRPETFAKQQGGGSPQPEHLSREDNLLAALAVNVNGSKTMSQDGAKGANKDEMGNRETKKTGDVAKRGNGSNNGNNNSEKKRKSQQSPDASKVGSLKDLAVKPVETETVVASVKQQVHDTTTVKSSLKDVSKEFLAHEARRDDSPKTETTVVGVEVKGPTPDDAGDKTEATPPVPPPRRKKVRPAGKRSASDVKTSESTDESSSSSSSQESEESVIECLSSGFNSPKVTIPSCVSSDDEDIIYQGNLVDERDPKALKRISESQEDSTPLNGKALKRNNSSKRVVVVVDTDVTPSTPVTEEVPRSPLARGVGFKDAPEEKHAGTYKSEEHRKNVQKMAQEIVDSVIEEAMKESVRLKYLKEDVDPVKLGITDAVTRWLRSQSPDVLSLPRNEDSESDISEELEADAEDKPPNGSKNLKSNPLPAPSVENIGNQLNHLVGDNDGTGRRVANIISEKNVLRECRNDDTPDLEDDAISNESVSCGEWDLWDCQHSFAQNYDEMLKKSHKKHTKNTNEHNIISADKITPHSSSHCVNSSSPLVLEYLGLPKYDPHANDTFSPIESTILGELVECSAVHGLCSSDMCDPALSVAKYYVLGPPPKTLSPVEDIECGSSESGDSSVTENDDGAMSLAEELASLAMPLPESWSVEPVRVGGGRQKQRRGDACRCEGRDVATADSGVESGGDDTNNAAAAVVARKREATSVFKRKLVGRLSGEGAPFPCGGICCILQ